MLCAGRSIHRLTQLERLDLGSNEFTDMVRRADAQVVWGEEGVWDKFSKCRCIMGLIHLGLCGDCVETNLKLDSLFLQFIEN